MNGMLSDPNVPGVEKLVATEVQMAWLEAPAKHVTAASLGHPTLVSPGRVFLVKGWNRAVCFLTVLYACYKCDGLLKAGSPKTYFIHWFHFKISMGQMKNPMALQAVPEEVKLPLGESRTPSKYFSFWHWFVDRTLHHDDVSNPSLLLLIFGSS